MYSPSLISSLDFEGSKEGVYSTRSPHIHALAVLGRAVSERDFLRIQTLITEYLKNNNFIVSNSVYITRFTIYDKNKTNKDTTEQLLNVIDYNRKQRLGDDRNVIVLPYHDIMSENDNEKNVKLKELLSYKTNKISSEINDKNKRHLYFSRKAI